MNGENLKLRMVKLAAKALRGEPVTTKYVRDVFGVSRATAKRDLQTLRDYLPNLGAA